MPDVFSNKMDNIIKKLNILKAKLSSGVITITPHETRSVYEIINAKSYHDKNIDGRGLKIGIIDVAFKTIKDKLEFAGKYKYNNQEFVESKQFGHGSEVASVIKNVLPKAELYACATLDGYTKESVDSISDCLQWCIDNNMNIINFSLGLTPALIALNPDVKDGLPKLEELCAKAEKAGIIIVAGSGNNGYKENQITTDYPSAYASVIAVGSVNKNQQWSTFSTTGYNLDFVTYGENIEVYDAYGNFQKVSGTSFSSPLLVGIIGLMLGQRPDLRKKDIITILKKNAIELGSVGRDHAYGYGLINNAKVPDDYVLIDDDIIIPTTEGFLKNKLNAIPLHENNIFGSNVKIGVTGYGCSDLADYNIKFFKNFAHDAKDPNVIASSRETIGDMFSSVILSKRIGICPKSINYVIRDRSDYGGFAAQDSGDINNWMINNKDKLDIVMVFPYTSPSMLKSLSDAGIIAVMCCYDNTNASVEGTIGQNTNDENAITVGFVSNKESIINNESNNRCNNYANDYMDCVGYAYGFDYMVKDENGNEISKYAINTDLVGGLERSIAAAMQVMAVLALMKEQYPKMNNAVKVRKLLPYICKEIPNAPKSQVGYGLIQAKLASELKLSEDFFD